MTKFSLSFALSCALLAFLLSIALSYGCKKEPLPHPIYGEWETVNAVGFKFDYKIQEGGLFCRSLPEYFGNTWFCFDYNRQADTLFVNIEADPERWVLDFQTRDAVLVNVKKESGSTDAFLLVRK